MRKDPIQITRHKKEAIKPFEMAEEIVFDQKDEEILGLLADLLEYPEEGWNDSFQAVENRCAARRRPSLDHFFAFSDSISECSLLELQEIYTRSFDLNPVCALEIGYHLFGEDYKRGEFLANLRESQNPFELGQEKQLPDYLPVVLRLLNMTADSEFRSALIGYCLIPALSRMSGTFRKKKNPYRHLIFLLEDFLKEIGLESRRSEHSEVRYQNV